MKDLILYSDVDFEFEFPTSQNVAEYILDRIETIVVETGRGNQTCIVNSIADEKYSYTDVITLSQKFASFLQQKGFMKGDTLLYSSHDGAKLHICLLGVWSAGGIVRSSYPDDFGDELSNRMKESCVKWILCDAQHLHETLNAKSHVDWNIEVIVVGSGCPSGCYSLQDILLASFDGSIRTSKTLTKPEDVALILQTSGTTGRSKGAVYTHERLLRNIIIFQHLPLIDMPKEAFLLTSKLTHFTGCVIPLAFFAAGRKIIINPSPCRRSIVDAIKRYKVRGILAFPKFLLSLANEADPREIGSLKFVATAGQVVGPSFVNAVKSISSIQSLHIIYGMTEAGILTVNSDWASLKLNVFKTLDECPPFSCGKLAPGSALRVKDLNTGRLLGPGEVGELCFCSPFSAVGYFNSSMMKPEEETFEGGQWVNSGDVGFYDRNGFIYIKDRIKEIFKYFNDHICPSELENILLTHPHVAQACVVGIPDPQGGDSIPRAFVVLKSEDYNELDNLETIKEFMNEKVPKYKQLKGGIFPLEEFPMGKSGKVLRKLLQNYDLASNNEC